MERNNGNTRAGSDLSKLLQYLAHSSADNGNFGALSQAVRFHKVKEKRVEYMCKIVEDYTESKVREAEIMRSFEVVKAMTARKIALDVALECAKIDLKTLQEVQRQQLN